MRGGKVRIHLNLNEDDIQFLRQRYGDVVGISGAVRQIVHERVTQLKKRADAVAKPVTGEIDLDDDE
jgi:uncharacterized protein YfaA (DUF2138 family)